MKQLICASVIFLAIAFISPLTLAEETEKDALKAFISEAPEHGDDRNGGRVISDPEEERDIKVGMKSPKEMVEIEPSSTPKIELTRISGAHVIANIDGKEELILVDDPSVFGGEKISDSELLEIIKNSLERSYSKAGFTHIPYEGFDVYIDTDFYDSYKDQFDDFFNKFEPRNAQMEDLTDWSSKIVSGKKMKVYVEPDTRCCWGYASPETGEAHLFFYEDFSYQLNPNICVKPYYIVFNGEPYYENPGELGDWWNYMRVALHEALHTKNPLPIHSRSWLTEGWSQYYAFNILSYFNDITQETADTYIYRGETNFKYNWPDYVANDYKDYYDYEIQNSAGYDITAWMFSMLRDDYSLDWNEFYDILNNNLESLDKSWELGGGGYYSIFTDTYIIDLFGRASGMSFNEIQAVFRYDGPSGPGWGVRNWENLDWYADLVPELSFSTLWPTPDETIDLIATVYNAGETDSYNVPVRFYNGATIIAEDTISVSSAGSNVVSIEFQTAYTGDYLITVIVDEENIKIESNDTNNTAIATLTVYPDTDFDGVADIIDNCPGVSNSDQTNSDTDSFGDACDNCPNDDNEEQINSDSDSHGDVCDNCMFADNEDQANDDTDSLGNACDNCPDDFNPDQADTDGDSIGDACDYICGDADGSGAINILDVTRIINYLYKGGAAPDPIESGDADGNGSINILDVTRLINYLYKGGPAPVCP